MNHDEIVALTRDCGGDWGLCHAQRLITTVSAIADTPTFDPECIWLAAHLHDWGGYARWAVAGVDHAARSVEVVAPLLAQWNCPPALASQVLECIQYHHGGPEQRSVESVLFTNADALDLLGTVGVLRIFAMNHRDLRGAIAATRRFTDISMRAVTLPLAQQLAQERLAQTQQLLEQFEQQTAGVY